MNRRIRIILLTLFLAIAGVAVTLSTVATATAGVPEAESPDMLTVTKTIVGGATIAQPGDVLTYRIGILNGTGNNVTLLMTDTLPAGVRLADRPSRNTVAGGDPTNVTRDIRGRTVGFKADFADGTGIEVFIPVRVNRCYDNVNKNITNTAFVSNVNGAGVNTDSVSFTVDCFNASTLDDLTWSVALADEPSDDGSRMILQRAWAGRFVRLNFRNDGQEPLEFDMRMPFGDFRLTLGWSGCLTCVRSAETAHVETVESQSYRVTVHPGDNYYMEFYAEPDTDLQNDSNVPFGVELCLPDFGEGFCDNGDSGRWQRKSVFYFVTRRDLGDAPDNTNNVGAPMIAYAGVPANFPTVHNAAAGVIQGPTHLNSQRFHLGNSVSAEIEADIGPDNDPTNNIEPAAGVPDLDSADDGTLPANWTLNHCTSTNINVQVFIHPDAVIAFGANPGYINIWLDSTRDGDWNDSTLCAGTPAHEHIVIDAPVDVAALGAGLHTIAVPTGLVPWANNADPAWARVMLTGTPSEKLTGLSHGDGRGRALPYLSGETEDYLINDPQGLKLNGDGNPGQPNDNGIPVRWRVRFANQGDQPIENFSLDIDLPNQTVQNILVTNENITCNPDATGVICTTTHLRNAPTTHFAGGEISFRTLAPLGTQIATMNATASGFSVTPVEIEDRVRLPSTAIIIQSPAAGTVSGETELEITGRVVGDTGTRAPIQFFLNDQLLGTTNADPDGQFTVTLPQAGVVSGNAILRAVMGEAEATQSIVINLSLGWDPATMRVTDPAAPDMPFAPFDSNGRVDQNGWLMALQSGEPHTITIRSDAAAMRLIMEDGTIIPMVIPKGEPCVFTAQITPPASRMGAQRIRIEATAQDGTITEGHGWIMQIAKRFSVVDADTGNPIPDVQFSNMRPAEDINWAPSDWQYVSVRRYAFENGLVDNIVTTDALGQAPGFSMGGAASWREVLCNESFQCGNGVSFQKFKTFGIPSTNWKGCLTCTILFPWGGSEEGETGIILTTLPAVRATTVDVNITSNGFEPAYLEVTPGTVINFINTDTTAHGTKSDSVTFSEDGFGVGAWTSGAITPGDSYFHTANTVGTFSYVDPANPGSTGILVVTTIPTAVTLSAQTTTAVTSLILLIVAILLTTTTLVVRRISR